MKFWGTGCVPAEKFTALAGSCYPASHREQLIEAAISVGTLDTLDTLWALLSARA